MGWHCPFIIGTLASLMHPWLLTTPVLLALVLACPRLAQAQAEEAPPEMVDSAPSLAQATAAPTPETLAPAAAQSPQVSPAAARDHGGVLIPYFGLNLPAGSAANGYSAGFRLGGLAGWAVTPRMSINGEFTLDLMDGDTDASMVKPHEYYLDFILSPLLHLGSGSVVVGPKLGWFTNNRSFTESDAASRRCLAETGSRSVCFGPALEAHSGHGLLFGFNAGGFRPLGRLTVGLLASANFRHFTTVNCGPYGCGGDYGLVTVTSLSLAAMF